MHIHRNVKRCNHKILSNYISWSKTKNRVKQKKQTKEQINWFLLAEIELEDGSLVWS